MAVGAEKHAAPDEKIDGEHETGQSAMHYFVEYVLPISIILIGAWIMFMFLWIGPVAVFKFILSFMPKNPGLWHALVLGTIIVICIVLPIPIWPPLMIVTAMVFGFWKGFLIDYCAMVLGAVISFGIGRYLLMQPFREYIEGSDYQKLRRMALVVETDYKAFNSVFLFRLKPMTTRSSLCSSFGFCSCRYGYGITCHRSSTSDSYTFLSQSCAMHS